MAKSLIGNNLYSDTRYKVSLYLSEDPTSVETFYLQTPKFLQQMSSYLSLSRISKDVSKDIKMTPGVTYPDYWTQQVVKYALKRFKVLSIDDVVGKNMSTTTSGNDLVSDPSKTKVKIELTFDRDIVKDHLVTQLEGLTHNLSNLSLDLSKGKINGSKITINSNIADLDPNFASPYGAEAPVRKVNGKVGYWDSKVYSALKGLNKNEKSSYSNFWKGASFTFTGEQKFHDGKVIDPKIKTTFKLSSVLYTTIPEAVKANTINEFTAKKENFCVDYFFFFVSQNTNSGKWYYFDENGSNIVPSTSDEHSYLSGERYIQIIKDPKNKSYKKFTSFPGNYSGPPTLTRSQLKNRPENAYCSVYSATETVEKEQNSFSDFKPKKTYVRFAIARYTYNSNGELVGKWLPVGHKNIYSNVLSAQEIIGAG